MSVKLRKRKLRGKNAKYEYKFYLDIYANGKRITETINHLVLNETHSRGYNIAMELIEHISRKRNMTAVEKHRIKLKFKNTVVNSGIIKHHSATRELDKKIKGYSTFP